MDYLDCKKRMIPKKILSKLEMLILSVGLGKTLFLIVNEIQIRSEVMKMVKKKI